jgi:hypothetical protein
MNRIEREAKIEHLAQALFDYAKDRYFYIPNVGGFYLKKNDTDFGTYISREMPSACLEFVWSELSEKIYPHEEEQLTRLSSSQILTRARQLFREAWGREKPKWCKGLRVWAHRASPSTKKILEHELEAIVVETWTEMERNRS